MSTSEKPGESFAELFAEAQQRPRRKELRVGDRVDVVVLKIGRDAVFVSLLGAEGGKEEGFIERTDLTDKSGNLAVVVGATIVAKVAETGGKAGAARLTPLVIRGSADADAVATAAPTTSNDVVLEAGLTVKGAVTRVERYGVFVQIAGTGGRKGRGLVPASDTGTPRNADLHKLFPVGMELSAKIVRVEEDGKIRLSISAMAMDEENRTFETFAKDRPDAKAKVEEKDRIGTFGQLLAKRGIASKK